MGRASMIWVFMAPTFAGLCVIVSLLIPDVPSSMQQWYILGAAVAGAVIAIPGSLIVSKMLGELK